MQTALSAAALSSSSAKPSSSNRIGATSKNRAPTPRRVGYDQVHVPHAKSSFEVIPAIQGNHLAIQGFLQRLLHRPSRAEFVSATLRPGYQPSERLVIKNPADQTLVAHVQLEPQLLRFGGSQIPISRFRDLAVLPEYRHRCFDDRIVHAAEAEAKRCGAMMVITRGEDYKLLRKHGWATLGSDPVSIVSPQRLLGQLPRPREPESPFYAATLPKTHVRIGRMTDLENLISIYDQHYAGAFGPAVRSEDRWSWLMSKRSHDRVYIFVENDSTMGYVVVCGASVVELVDVTEDGRASARLLECVGADAIDQGRHTLRIHAPITDRVHQWADLAGGQVFASATEDSWMVKILSYRTLLRRLAHEMHRRRPKVMHELSVRIGAEELLIKPGVRSMKVTRGSSSERRIGLTTCAAAQLFLGYRTVDELAAGQQLVASGDNAMQTARQLFPALMLWRTRWDDMPVLNS